MSGRTMLFNPYTGKPRHPSDIVSDPAGLLMPDPDLPVLAARKAWPLVRCAAGRDGDCTHISCPQLRDTEPQATGRHCPLDNEDERT